MATKNTQVDHPESENTNDVRIRTFRSKEEKQAEIDAKIAYHEAKIEALRAKRIALDKPVTRKRKPGYTKLAASAKEAGVPPELILAFIEQNRKT